MLKVKVMCPHCRKRQGYWTKSKYLVNWNTKTNKVTKKRKACIQCNKSFSVIDNWCKGVII